VKNTARLIALCAALALNQSSVLAHDFTDDIAKYNEAAAGKKLVSKESIAARVALECSQGMMEQADVKLLLRIRGLTNSALRELGEQPACDALENEGVESLKQALKLSESAPAK
jgi:hypothetical protein